ncbi:hypothetical protein ARMSODRAFT_980133 [Armillaria solidipes]|uniref:Uncharacterized protein n=1 Tax=Armillaria solidipes TaxID=1076256 RepID=A0A2H3AWX5_9AGAR|nr:hypothetical protein ARMSODRAFT_980133 [Armillaria solidipes]
MFSDEFREFLSIRCTRLEALVNRTESVMVDAMSIRVQVTAMQRYWLELVAGLDYMQIHQPVMNGKVQRDETFDFNRLIGVFTLSLDVAEQHMKAGIPVYLVRPIEQFTNQIILKAEQPTVFSRSKARASGPLGKGSPQRSKAQNLQSTRDKFADLSGRYAPPTIPAWAGANAKIDKDSECSQQREAQARHIQSRHDANGEKKDYNINMGYAFPDPTLFVYASATRQSTYFRQWEHYRDTLIYRVASSTSNATPVCPQVWRELLAMPFKKEHTKTIKAHDTMLDMMGTALQMSRPDVRSPTTHTDEPFDVKRGRYLVWELCELNFRLELLAIDTHLTHSLVSDDTDFQLKCQNAILKLLPGESLVPLPSHSVTSSVPLVFEAKGLLDPSGDEASLKVEKALVQHYVQTFFDRFGRPPVLPCMPHQSALVNQPEEQEGEK